MHWVLSRNTWWVLGLYLLFHVLLGLAFTWLYLWSGQVHPANSSAVETGFWKLAHFSFTTQTTLGYGDFAPQGWATLLSASHTGLGMILNAVALGLVTAKIVRRQPIFIFAGKVAHDFNTHELHFRFWNRDAASYCEVTTSLTLRRLPLPDDDKALSFRNCPVILRKKSPPFVGSMSVIRIITFMDGLDPKKVEKPRIRRDNHVSVLNVGPEDELVLLISAVSVDSGASVVARRVYRLTDIVCGSFEAVDKDVDPRDWRQHDFSALGRVTPPPTGACRSCYLGGQCPLRKPGA